MGIACIALDEWDDGILRKKIKELHVKLKHAPIDKIGHMLGVAYPERCGQILSRELKSIKCLACEQRKPRGRVPQSAMPRDPYFNAELGVDLWFLRGSVILHLVCLFTRFVVCIEISDKRPQTVILGIIENWFRFFGVPTSIITDEGPEFVNDEFLTFGERFDFVVKAVAAQAHWAMGQVETQHRLLRKMCEIILHEDLDLSIAQAVAQVTMAYNYMPIAALGFSPNQLVFGTATKWPDFQGASLPALSGYVNPLNYSGSYIEKFLRNLYAARAAFHKADVICKLERAEKGCLPMGRRNQTDLQVGDEVLYYREPKFKGQVSWRGPGKVLGVSDTVILIRHGGHVTSKAPCHVKKWVPGWVPGIEGGRPIGEQDGDVQDDVHAVNGAHDHGIDDGVVEEANEVDGVKEVPIEQEDIHSIREDLPIVDNLPIARRTRSSSRANDGASIRVDDEEEAECQRRRAVLEAMEQEIIREDEQAMALAAAKNHSEIHTRSKKAKSAPFMAAKEKELSAWSKYDAMETVKRIPGKQVIDTRWVLTEKLTEAGRIPKARLVAKGFQEEGGKEIETYSPTVSKSTWRLLISMAASKGWIPGTLDVTNAFLNGDAIQREVYLNAPKEAGLGLDEAWKLKKPVYGLNDASLAWFRNLCKKMLQCGAKQVKYEPCAFLFYQNYELCGVACVHVDDIFVAMDEKTKTRFVSQFKEMVPISKEKWKDFDFCGITVHSIFDEQGVLKEITIDQINYIENSEVVPIQCNDRKGKAKLTEEEHTNYRSIVGTLTWITSQTRPDWAFQATMLAQRASAPTIADLKGANKVMKKMQDEQLKIRYPALDLKEAYLVGYSDASWGNGEEGSTVGGFVWCIVSLRAGHELFSPISWVSRRLRRVVRSTMAGETLACAQALDNLFPITSVTEKLFLRDLPVLVRIDCRSCFDHLRGHKNLTEKRLVVEIQAIKEMVEQGIVTQVQWVPSERELADTLTKAGYIKGFLKCFKTSLLP